MTPFPVRRVTLYKHGVGYFEREASVQGNQAVTLTFPQREVSDVLKSLTVVDLNGGLVSAVSFDSTTPVEKLLAEIALTVPDSGSLAGLLPQLKGANVLITPTAEAGTEGVLLGLDTIEAASEGRAVKQLRVAVLAAAGEVKSFILSDVTVQFLDDSVRRDLDYYLRTHLAAKNKNARTFTLYTEGDGERTLRVGYLRESPVWKATYRVLLHATESPRLQGWAVIDNSGDDDWLDVELALVAGLPVSFVHDLYTPRYVRRPVVEVQETTGVLPPMTEMGFDDMVTMDSDREDILYSMPVPASSISRRMASEAGGSRSRPAESTVRQQTRERQVGDLFEYAVDHPVTVKRNQSALVPIVGASFDGKRALLYQKQARAENPVRCVEFVNTTGLTLEGGPVLVLDSGDYVGEAMLDTLKPSDTRLLGYAVDLGVRVTDSIKSKRESATRVTIRHGRIRITTADAARTIYTFHVVGPSQRGEEVLYLDHPREDYDLVTPAKPHETTENYWRFKLTLPAAGPFEFKVECRRPRDEVLMVGATTPETVAVWLKQKLIDTSTDKALKAVFAARDREAYLQAAIARLDQERSQIHADQKRLRENLTALGERSSEVKLRERLVLTLTKQEDRLAMIDVEQATNTRDLQDATRELATKIEAIEVQS